VSEQHQKRWVDFSNRGKKDPLTRVGYGLDASGHCSTRNQLRKFILIVHTSNIWATSHVPELLEQMQIVRHDDVQGITNSVVGRSGHHQHWNSEMKRYPDDST
jgi:hypothetical protein